MRTAMLLKLLHILWLCLNRVTGTAGFKTTCDVPSVQEGEATNITCYFEKDLRQTRSECTLHKYDSDGNYKDILNCLWRGDDTPDCIVDQGYILKGYVTNTLVLEIPSTSKEHVATYACMTIPSNSSDIETCQFTFEDTCAECSTQPQHITHPNPEENDNNTIVTIVIIACLLVALTIMFVVLICRCRRRRTRNTKGAGQKTPNTTAQRLLHETDKNIKKFEKDRLPFDHDTYDKALKLLEEEDEVMIMGPEKCGKTTIGRALQRYFRGKEYTPLDLNQHDSWHLFAPFKGKLIILLDEVFTIGDIVLDEEHWSSVFRSMKDRRYRVIVIIKTDRDPEDVENNCPPFLKDFPKVCVVNDNLKNELFRVCKRGHLNDLNSLLRQHVHINVRNTKGETPLHIACAFHHEDIVKALLDATQNGQGQTPLHHARDGQSQTPLHHACNRYEATEAASESATSTDEVDDDQAISVSRADDDENERRIITATNTSDEKRNTESADFSHQNTTDASIHATQEGDKKFTGTQADRITELLLERGAEREATDSTGRTPLHLACDKGNRAAVTSLLNADVDIEAADKHGLRPLHLACRTGDAEIINSLLSQNCVVDARDAKQRTPLHWACENDKDVAVRLLLQHGANVEADVDGVRPLHVASKRGIEKIVQILLHHGADVNAKDPDGQKPSSIAKSYDHKKLIPLLKEAERKSKGGIFRL